MSVRELLGLLLRSLDERQAEGRQGQAAGGGGAVIGPDTPLSALLAPRKGG
jgi:hypothetical protein